MHRAPLDVSGYPMDRIDVGENELHAFVDCRLTPGERCKVELHLATHPTVAERVRNLLAQRAVLGRGLRGRRAGPPCTGRRKRSPAPYDGAGSFGGPPLPWSPGA